MSLRAIAAWKAANHHVDAACQRPPSITRRQFARAAAGTAVLGSAFSSSLLRPGLADTRASFAPVPIPGGSPALGGSFHVFGPKSIDPIDAEPITITNFGGFVGLSYPSGMVTQTNTRTGEQAGSNPPLFKGLLGLLAALRVARSGLPARQVERPQHSQHPGLVSL
jgi:hypothetical protein